MPVSNLLKSWRSNTVAILLAMPLSTSVAGQQMEEVVVIKAFTPDEKLQTSEVSELLDADDMSIAGDSDIGAALKRLPGLSLVGGRFIYVRGLGERYSSTYVNGTSMPSPEPLQRAVPLDLFDTSVVKNVLVQKTHSANYGIEFSGGIVDIRTAAVPNEPFFKIKTSTSYNDISTSQSGLTYAGSGRDWLGYDDGERSRPAIVKANDQNYKRTFVRNSPLSGAQQDAITLSFNNNWQLQSDSNPYDWSYAMAGGARYQFSDRLELGFIASGSLSNKWRNRMRKITRYDYLDLANQTASERRVFVDSIESTRNELLVSADEANGIARVSDRNLTQRTINSNLLFSAGADIDSTHLINLTLMQVRKSSDLASSGLEANPFEELLVQQEQLVWTENEIMLRQLAGQHYLAVGELNWRYSQINSSRDTPDSRVIEQNIRNGAPVFVSTSDPSRSWTELDDKTTEYGFDLSLPLSSNASFLSALKLKTGYARMEQQRVFDSFPYTFNTDLLALDANAALLPLTQLTDTSACAIGQAAATDDSCYLFTGASATSIQANGHIDLDEGFFRDPDTPEGFVGTFETEAFYVLWDAQLTDKFRFTLGTRHERSSKSLINPLTGGVLLSEADQNALDRGRATLAELISAPSETFRLNSTSISWDFYDNMILRSAYSESVNRPILRELSPLSFYNPDEDETYIGNTKLKIARIANFDIRYEWYYGEGNYFGLTYFKKSIRDPVEIEETDGEDPKLVWVNLDSAKNRGLEFEIKHYLSSRIMLSANTTLIDSEVIDSRLTAPIFNDERPMQGLSNELYNLQLTYESDVHTVSLAYNHFSERLISMRSADGKNKHAVYEQPFNSLNFNYKSSLYIEDSVFEFGFKVTNILNERVERKAALLAPSIESARDPSLADIRLPYDDYEVGVTYGVSITWKQY